MIKKALALFRVILFSIYRLADQNKMKYLTSIVYNIENFVNLLSLSKVCGKLMKLPRLSNDKYGLYYMKIKRTSILNVVTLLFSRTPFRRFLVVVKVDISILIKEMQRKYKLLKHFQQFFSLLRLILFIKHIFCAF